MEPEARSLGRRLYSGSKMTGRRGALICALPAASDMALWDTIKGTGALGVCVYRLLGRETLESVTPYGASLLRTAARSTPAGNR